MNLFKKEERSINYETLIESLSSNKIYISKASVEKIPVVAQSIKKIAGTISSLPIELIIKEQFKNTILENDPRLYLLNTECNEFQTAYSYKNRIVEDLLFYGVHYSYIERDGKIKGLHPIDYTTVTEKNIIDNDGKIIDKEIIYTLNNTVQQRNGYEILRIDTGGRGILNSTNLLELILSHDDILKSAITNISYPSGYLKTDGRLTQNTINKMKESWRKIYGGKNNIGKTIILEEGLTYHPLNIDLNNIQSLDNKKAFIEDVERLFNLFNISSNEDYLKYTISPLLSCIENALTTQLLLTSEKQNNTKFIFNTEEVAKASERERIEAISIAVKSGLLTVNEARLRLNENPFILDSRKDFLSMSQGNIFLFADSTLTVPNMGISLDAEGKLEAKPQGEKHD